MGIRSALCWGYAPLLLLGANGLAFWLIAAGRAHWQLAVLLLVAIAFSFAAEHALPYASDWNRSHGDAARDTAHALVNEVANFSGDSKGSASRCPSAARNSPSSPTAIWTA